MIDLRRLREEPAYRAGIERKRVREGLLDEVLAADDTRRSLQAAVEELRARQNAASKEIGRAAPDERPAKIEAASALKDELAAKEPELAEADARLLVVALQVPNPADESVPDGGEDDSVTVREHGDRPGAPPLDHEELGARLGFVETKQAVEMSGSRFAYLMREAVLLELALVQWVVGKVVAAGFTPVVPPVLVREHAMEEAGFFPTDRAQVYEVDGGELFLVGTSEIPLSALQRGELLDAADLPIRYSGISSCFRREAGTYGKDTRGIFRVHQFDKVEMFAYVDPDRSWEELDAILAVEESIVQGLGLPYRVQNIAAGDLGAAAAKKFDIEVWLPSEGRYRELTSCSNYTDFSARRLGTRVRGDGGNRLVHTLNGTASAVGRTLVNLFEHYQRPDGSLAVPEVLIPYTGFDHVPARDPRLTAMPLDLFAGIYVRDYDTACAWYTRLFGFDPFVVSATEAVWELAPRRSIVIEVNADHAGHAIHTVFVDDIDAFVAAAATQGIEPATRETYDNGVRKAVYRDPDGNEIGIGCAPA